MKRKDKIVISIIEDQNEIGISLKNYFNHNTGYICDMHYTDAKSAIDALPSCKPDIVICDIGLPDLNGVECLKLLVPKMKETKFIMFTVFDTDKYLFEALRIGACGYILKDDSFQSIVNAVTEAYNGGGPMSPEIARKVIASFKNSESNANLEKLTNHQIDILRMISDGLLNKEIASLLNINEGSLKIQITSIYKKLQVNNRVEASSLYFRSKG